MATQPPLRLLHVLCQRPGFSGSGIFLQAMVREAAAQGIPQHVICGGPPGTSHEELPPLCPSDVTVVQMPSVEIPFDVCGMSDVMPYASTMFSSLSEEQVNAYIAAFRHALRKCADLFHPTVVHCHHLWLVSALAATEPLLRGCRIVASAHNTAMRQLATNPHYAPRIMAGLRQLDCVGVLTPESLHQTVEVFGIEENRICVTAAGYRVDLFFATDIPRPVLVEQLRATEGVCIPNARNTVICTYVGRLSTPKGVPFLLQGFTLARERWMRKTCNQVCLLLVGGVGSGEDGKNVVDMASHTEGVLVLGPQSQKIVGHILRCSDVFVLTSLYEGLPLVLLEALACGCTSVLSDLPTIRSWLPQEWRHDGTCTCVPPLATVNTDVPVVDDLKRFVTDVADALFAHMTQALSVTDIQCRLTRAKRLEQFSWRAVFDRYHKDVYAND